MMRALGFWLCAMCVTGAAWGQAAPSPPSASAPAAAAPASPYSATVPVAGTSDSQRTAAIGAALATVLQQVSPGFTAAPAVIAGASAYVRKYRYQRAPSGSGLVLTVDFDPGAVGRLLKGAGATAVAAAPGGAGAAGAATGGGGTPAAAASAGAASPVAGGGPATIWVGGITDSHAFATMLSTLRGDSDLRDVMPVGAEGDGVLLTLTTNAPLQTVLQALEGPAGHLAQATQAHAGADASLEWTP